MTDFLAFGASTRKTVAAAGTAEPLSTTSTACRRIDICAEMNNTGVICVGDNGVVASLATRCGIPLNAGDFHSIDTFDLKDVYLDTTVNGDGVTYTYWKG